MIREASIIPIMLKGGHGSQLGASDEVFDFLKDPAEYIYILTDGKPLSG